MKKLIILSILFSFSKVFAQSDTLKNDSLYFISNEKYRGVVFCTRYPLNIKGDESTRFSPNKEELIKADLILEQFFKKSKNKKKVNQFNTDECPDIYTNIYKYYRQYRGLVSKKGDRLLIINFIYNDELSNYPNYLSHWINVCDGCSRYWIIKVNLNNNKVTFINVNGVG